MTTEFDAIPSVLNPVQVDALERILLLTPAKRRVAVAIAFAGITLQDLGEQSGMDRQQAYRWLSAREHRMPFGAALRFARVLGDVDAQLLFEDWV